MATLAGATGKDVIMVDALSKELCSLTQGHCLVDYPHLAGPPPVATAAEPLDVHEVTLIQRGYTPEIVFLGTRQDCLDFAEECRADTIGCDFRVARSGRTAAWMKGGEA